MSSISSSVSQWQPRLGPRVLASALIAAVVGGSAWMAVRSERVHRLLAASLHQLIRPAISISAAPPSPNGTPSELVANLDVAGQRDRIARTWAAIGELSGALARDMHAPRSERERFLRYDCARLERLASEFESVDHPLAFAGKSRLRAISSKYGERCERILQRARTQARNDED